MTQEKIAIDLDEVKFEFMQPFTEWHNRKYGTTWRPQELRTYNIWETWGISEEAAIERVLEFYGTSEFKNLKPMDGSVEGVKELAKRFSLCNITARPPEIKDLTVSAVTRHFPIHPASIHFASDFFKTGHGKKSSICLTEGVSIIIEDNLSYALDCAQHGISVILLDKPWNQTNNALPGNIIRVKDWSQVPKTADSLLKR